MPISLKPDETVYVDRKSKPSDYAMPSMAAAPDYYEIGLLISGDRKFFSYQTVQIAHPGNIGILKPNIFHKTLPMSDEPYDRYLIKFKYEAAQPVIDLLGKSNFDSICMRYLSFAPEELTAIQRQFEDMLNEYQRGLEHSQFILQGMLQRLILTIYRHHLPAQNTTVTYKNHDERIYKSLIYLEENLEYNPSIEEVAQNVSLSPSHFSKLFKKVVGCSFTDYVTSVRIQHAQVLLARTELSINEIAVRVGLCNGNYLCNLFRNNTGCSPSEFRKNV